MRELTDKKLYMFICALDIIFQQHCLFIMYILVWMHDGFMGVVQTSEWWTIRELNICNAGDVPSR